MQKAITGARGTPDASMAAIKGITPHEQKGDKAPASEAAKMVTHGLPEKARAMWASIPVALAYPANAIAKTKKGAMLHMACKENVRLFNDWV
jgi:hypothetical protein